MSQQQRAECFSQSWEAVCVCKMKPQKLPCLPFTLPVRADQLASLPAPTIWEPLKCTPFGFQSPWVLFHSDLCNNLITDPVVPLFLTQNTFSWAPKTTPCHCPVRWRFGKISSFTKINHSSLSQGTTLHTAQPTFRPDAFHKYLCGRTPLSQALS